MSKSISRWMSDRALMLQGEKGTRLVLVHLSKESKGALKWVHQEAGD